MDHEILLKIIRRKPNGIKSTEIRSAYQKETDEMVPIGEEKEALVQMREERKIKFITEPWKEACWVVTPDYVDGGDYPKNECNLFW